MAPVGSYESLMAAIQAGAGSVYFGVGNLNMRSKSSQNFGLDDLAQIASICTTHGIKSYVTINSVIFDSELEAMRELVNAVAQNGITAIIAADQAVIQYARQRGVEVHISTQCNITNIEAVRYYARFADVMVTARELSLDQVKAITTAIEREQITGLRPFGENRDICSWSAVHGRIGQMLPKSRSAQLISQSGCLPAALPTRLYR